MNDLLAAERYARALFELAREAGEDQAVEDELAAFSDALKARPEIEKFLNHPRLAADEKAGMIRRLYGKNRPLLADFYAVLFRKSRFGLIHDVASVFKKIADLAQGEASAEIRTARPLGPEAERRIVLKLEKLSGAKIAAHSVVDPSLIGGVAVRLGHRVFDGSVKAKIRNLKKELQAIRNF